MSNQEIIVNENKRMITGSFEARSMMAESTMNNDNNEVESKYLTTDISAMGNNNGHAFAEISNGFQANSISRSILTNVSQETSSNSPNEVMFRREETDLPPSQPVAETSQNSNIGRPKVRALS